LKFDFYFDKDTCPANQSNALRLPKTFAGIISASALAVGFNAAHYI
jgi:hypothetical protein